MSELIDPLPSSSSADAEAPFLLLREAVAEEEDATGFFAAAAAALGAPFLGEAFAPSEAARVLSFFSGSKSETTSPPPPPPLACPLPSLLTPETVTSLVERGALRPPPEDLSGVLDADEAFPPCSVAAPL